MIENLCDNMVNLQTELTDFRKCVEPYHYSIPDNTELKNWPGKLDTLNSSKFILGSPFFKTEGIYSYSIEKSVTGGFILNENDYNIDYSYQSIKLSINDISSNTGATSNHYLVFPYSYVGIYLDSVSIPTNYIYCTIDSNREYNSSTPIVYYSISENLNYNINESNYVDCTNGIQSVVLESNTSNGYIIFKIMGLISQLDSLTISFRKIIQVQ